MDNQIQRFVELHNMQQTRLPPALMQVTKFVKNVLIMRG
jgi:hypothetical protein